MAAVDRADLIYHESQTAALCGVHAVNTLLQAPHFSEIEMAQIAQELDAAEHALMASGGMESAEFLQYIAEGSGNVAENGMFSIQVLSRALEVFGLQAVPLNSPDAKAAREDPTTQTAFICNLQEHWFTIRKIHDQWWNLNSVFSAPEPLSNFYLSAFLGTLQDEGYTIFVIVGELPHSQPPASEEDRAVPGQPGRWFTPEEARTATEERERLKKSGFAQAAARGVMDKASEQGTWVTLQRPGAKRGHDAMDTGSGSSSRVEGMDGVEGNDPDLAKALAASLADIEGPSSSSRPHSRAWAAVTAAEDEEADLAAAIAASLADQPGTSRAGELAAQQQQQQQLEQQQQQQQQQQEQQQRGKRPEAPQSSVDAHIGGPAGADLADDDDDAELAAAIAASLQPPEQQERQQQQEQAAGDRPAGEQQGQQGQEQQPEGTGSVGVPPASAGLQLPELQPEPEAGAEGTILVALRLPGGSRASRRFCSGTDTVGHLAAFAAAQGADMAGCQLAAQFPRRLFSDWQQSLAAAGVGHQELVAVEPKA